VHQFIVCDDQAQRFYQRRGSKRSMEIHFGPARKEQQRDFRGIRNGGAMQGRITDRGAMALLASTRAPCSRRKRATFAWFCSAA
jgi:hypothetical protein